VDIVITGRRTDVPERFKRLAEEKLGKVAQFAPRAQRIDVELSHERNPRQADNCEKVEITVRNKGPVVRAEACADDALAALDLATGKLVERLRRMGDRKKVHHGRHTPPSVRSAERLPRSTPLGNGIEVTGAVSGVGLAVVERPHPEAASPDDGPDRSDLPEGAEELADSPVVIRTKEHAAVPMTIEQALYEMELVGHDFYLFVDAACGKPSVVYRRRGWNYGVIRLGADASDVPAGAEHTATETP
jgi:ribosomal subunit interface protein